MGNATAKDIAKKLGLSPATVSVALNGKPGVSQATRERVLAAAAELGFEIEVDESIQPEEKPAKKREKKAEEKPADAEPEAAEAVVEAVETVEE